MLFIVCYISFARFLNGEKDLNDDAMYTWMYDNMIEFEDTTTSSIKQESDNSVELPTA